MLKQLLVIGFIAVILSKSTFACVDDPIQEIENLGKKVAIKLKPGTTLTESEKTSWLMDDDGMLVIGLIASACVEGMPQLELELNNEQSTCFNEAQDKSEKRIADSERLHTNFYDPKFREKIRAQEFISKTCRIDAFQLWEAALAKEYQIDLPCIKDNPNLISLLRRAIKRNEEYFEERTSPQILKGATLSSRDKEKYVAKRREELKQSQELGGLLSSSPNVGAFRKWFDSFKEMTPFKGYQILDAPEVSDHPEKQTSLENILMGLGAKVGPVRVGCQFPTVKNTNDKDKDKDKDKGIDRLLSSASWSSLGAPSAPAAAPTPEQGASQ